MSSKSYLIHGSKDGDFNVECTGTLHKISSVDLGTISELAPLASTGSVSIEELKIFAKRLGYETTDDVAKKSNNRLRLRLQTHLDGYAKIEVLFDQLCEVNPGTIAVVERKPTTNVFKRLAFIPHYTKLITNYMYPVIGVDGAAMKPVSLGRGRYLGKSVVSVISSRLPGNHIIVLAFCISESENSDDLQWLFRLLSSNGIELDRSDMTIISDRGTAIVKAINDNFTNAIQHHCAKHLERNLKAHGFTKFLGLFWKCRNAHASYGNRLV
jgi:hypothetical protein